MSLKVIVNGAKGKMGTMLCQTLSENKEFNLVGAANSTQELTKLLGSKDSDIVVDFTHPKVVYENALQIIKAKRRPVIGTTGLSLDQIEYLKNLCLQQNLGGIIAPNFSLGAILMMKYAAFSAHYFKQCQIVEYHHPQKADSPSGTALQTTQMISEIWLNNRKHDTKIPIHSVRLPGFLAHQEVIFGSDGELLTLRHDATDRKCFLPGIIFACKKVMELKDLVYGLDNLLTAGF